MGMRTGATFTSAAISTGSVGQEMASGEVQALIGEERYQAVKAKDPHPLFVALTMAHEGKSFGRILGRRGADQGVEKIWPRSRIHELVQRINATLNSRSLLAESKRQAQSGSGIPVYLFHNQDNSPRHPVGRVIAAVSRYIRGKVHAIGIAYISDLDARERIRNRELDTCSIEAELEFQRSSSPSDHADSPGRAWIVNAVRKISGLALGSRALQSPGFADAGILATVQEFDADTDSYNEKVQVLDLEKRLMEREKEIRNLEAEVQCLRQDAEANRTTAKVMELGEKYLEGTSLSQTEKSFLMNEIQEMAHSFGASNEELEAQLASHIKQQIKRLEKMRRYYSSTISIPAPPERGSEDLSGDQGILSNPLIPRPLPKDL
jgi:hypothetical protein